MLTWRTQAGFSTHLLFCTARPHPDPLGVCIDIDNPIAQAPKGGGGPEPSPEQIGMLADMGFSIPQARKALRETVRRLNAVQFPAAL